jgi:hypothetical protein
MQIFDHNIGFCEKRHFFAENWQKSQKIVIMTSTPGLEGEGWNPGEVRSKQSNVCRYYLKAL